MNIIEIMKESCKNQINQMQLTNMLIGVVTSIEPLQIEVDQQYLLGEDFLILTRAVTDYEIEMSVDHTTEEHTHTHDIKDTYTDGGEASEETHKHNYVGRKTFLVHNALKVDEKVVLVKCTGGQRYYVIDRLGGD